MDASASEKVLASAKMAHLITLVKDNQLLTALALFILWQAGAFMTISNEVSGVMC